MLAGRTLLLGVLAVGVASPALAQSGLTYRFRGDSLTGQVWIQGDNARRELESGEGGTAAGRVEIWKSGGKQVLVLNPKDRTYYDMATLPEPTMNNAPRLAALSVRTPFRVEGVEDVRVELRTLPDLEEISSYPCRRSIVTFSYALRLSMDVGPTKDPAAGRTIPARVEGTDDICMMEMAAAPRLPFNHALAWRSQLADVDREIANRMSELKGMPVARVLKVSRRIEGGETVNDTTAMMLSDIKEAQVAADRFEVPKDYTVKVPVRPPSPVRR